MTSTQVLIPESSQISRYHIRPKLCIGGGKLTIKDGLGRDIYTVRTKESGFFKKQFAFANMDGR